MALSERAYQQGVSMNPLVGFRAFADGARLATDRRLLRYTLIPATISLLIILIGFSFASELIDEAGKSLRSSLPQWLAFLEWFLIPLLYLLGIALSAWLFGFLAVILASPFLGALANAVERKVYGTAPPDDAGLWRGLLDGLAREGRKLAYHLPRLLIVFVLTLIPVVNLVSPLLWLVFGAWTMAVQFCDYPGENRQQPFSATLAQLRAHRAAALGFGICACLALAVPLLNFLLIPVAVSGGTLLWHQMATATDATATDAMATDATATDTRSSGGNRP